MLGTFVAYREHAHDGGAERARDLLLCEARRFRRVPQQALIVGVEHSVADARYPIVSAGADQYLETGDLSVAQVAETADHPG